MKKLIAASVATVVFCGGALAQVAGMGAISGSVRDASGGAIADAEVVISNESRGVRRAVQTTDAGVFAAPSLVPSTGYTVTINKPGFGTYELKDIQVQVGQNVDLPIVLTVAGAATQIQVEATAPIVDSAKTDVSQAVNSRQILDLPINGRRVDSF